ncbi:hypothetical protein BDV27DRAFT_134975, partial [Aspergillus caelatus]
MTTKAPSPLQRDQVLLLPLGLPLSLHRIEDLSAYIKSKSRVLGTYRGIGVWFTIAVVLIHDPV